MIVKINKVDQDQSWHINTRRSLEKLQAEVVQLDFLQIGINGLFGHLRALSGIEQTAHFRKVWGLIKNPIKYPPTEESRHAEFQQNVLIDSETKEPITQARTIIFGNTIIYKPLGA